MQKDYPSTILLLNGPLNPSYVYFQNRRIHWIKKLEHGKKKIESFIRFNGKKNKYCSEGLQGVMC